MNYCSATICVKQFHFALFPVCGFCLFGFYRLRKISPVFIFLFGYYCLEAGNIYIFLRSDNTTDPQVTVCLERIAEKKPSTLKKYILDERTTEVHCCSSPSARIRHDVERERVKKVQRMKKKNTHTAEKIDGKMDLSRL